MFFLFRSYIDNVLSKQNELNLIVYFIETRQHFHRLCFFQSLLQTEQNMNMAPGSFRSYRSAVKNIMRVVSGGSRESDESCYFASTCLAAEYLIKNAYLTG